LAALSWMCKDVGFQGAGYFGLRRGHSNVTPGLQDTGINDVLKFQDTGAIFATGKEWIIRGKRYFGPP